MSNEVLVPSRVLGEMKLSQNADDIERLIINRERILCYQLNEKKKIVVVQNEDFSNKLRQKINEMSRFLLPYDYFFAILNDINRFAVEIEVVSEEIRQFIERISLGIDQQIFECNQLYNEGQITLSRIIAYDKAAARRDFIEVMGNSVLINMFNKSTRL